MGRVGTAKLYPPQTRLNIPLLIIHLRERFLSQTLKVFAAKHNHNLQKTPTKRIISIIWGELPDPKGFSVRLGTLLAKYAVRQDNLASEGNL
jgi:hypothetical protein